MNCPKCKEGFVVVDIKVTAAYSDYRESRPEGLNIKYKCNVCDVVPVLPSDKYPTNLDSLRKTIQRQLNSDKESPVRIRI